jgi:hypothetical protein
MKHSAFTPSPKRFELDLNNMLHPAQAYAHPRDVVHDPDLTVNEKRAVLASWASDACAVEAAPTLRCAPVLAARSQSTGSLKRYARSTCTNARSARCGAGPSMFRLRRARTQPGLRKRAVELRIPTPREASASHM